MDVLSVEIIGCENRATFMIDMEQSIYDALEDIEATWNVIELMRDYNSKMISTLYFDDFNCQVTYPAGDVTKDKYWRHVKGALIRARFTEKVIEAVEEEFFEEG